ncbi:hypothetical protein ABID19_001222 [Mesorhizobium robiniae]|uniref:Bacteriophage tail tape measure C-terminal domain-containing protein n=1 Tax=Mesorhizobium robiniae TaxID=559315 RepID=A0ABV2GIT7_9HYPH
MANDDQILVVSLEARLNQFEKSFQRAVQISNKNFGDIEQRAKTMTSRLDSSFAKIGTGLKGGAIGMFTGVGAAATAALAPIALFQKALDTIDIASHLVDTADRIGLSTTALQELGFGFAQAGVEQSEFETGMEQFSKRIGEAATKGGELAKILNTNGIAMRDANGQIRSSEDLLGSYAELVRNATTEQEKMLLVTEAFGRGGGAMLVGLNDGAKGILNMKKAAEDAGGVIDEQLLRRAEEMGDRWDAAWHRFTVSSQSAILTAVEGLDSLNGRMQEFLKNRQAVEMGSMAGSLVGKPGDVLTGPGKGGKPDAIDVRSAQAFGGEIAKADDKLIEHLKARYGDASRRATIIPGEPSTGGKGGGTARAVSPDSFEREIAQTQRRTAILRAETAAQASINPLIDDYGAAVDKARIKQELLNAAQEAGRAITPELAAAIDATAQAYGDASADAQRLADTQDEAKEKAKQWADLQQDLVGGFLHDLKDGVKPVDALFNAVNRLADVAIDNLLKKLSEVKGASGEGGLFGGLLGFVGNLFGFSAGGEVKADSWAGLRLAGGGGVRGPGTSTSDSIPAMLSDGEYVVNAAATAKHRPLIEAINADRLVAFARGGGVGDDGKAARLWRAANQNAAPAINISTNVTVNAQGGDPAANADLAKQTARETKEAVRAVVIEELLTQKRQGGLMTGRYA